MFENKRLDRRYAISQESGVGVDNDRNQSIARPQYEQFLHLSFVKKPVDLVCALGRDEHDQVRPGGRLVFSQNHKSNSRRLKASGQSLARLETLNQKLLNLRPCVLEPLHGHRIERFLEAHKVSPRRPQDPRAVVSCFVFAVRYRRYMLWRSSLVRRPCQAGITRVGGTIDTVLR